MIKKWKNVFIEYRSRCPCIQLKGLGLSLWYFNATFNQYIVAMCASLICPLKNCKEFAVCCVNVGDSYGYILGEKRGIQEITIATGSKLSEIPSVVKNTISPSLAKVIEHVRFCNSGLLP
jgi:hypothetical protein